MKINPITMRTVNPYQATQRTQKTAEKSSFQDKIEISSKAKEMQLSSSYSAERAEKVQQLKADIDSGKYKVDARKVAQDMLKYYRF